MTIAEFPSLTCAPPVRAGFSSFKCLPMQYPRRACRDFLVLASLDPATIKIGPAAVEPARAPADCYFSIALTRMHGELVVMLCEKSDGYRYTLDCTTAVAISRQALNSTAIETARLIWSRRKLAIDPTYSVMVQHRLVHEGQLGFAEAIRHQNYAPSDATDQIMAMACRGLVNVHIDGHLKPDTRITAPTPADRDRSHYFK